MEGSLVKKRESKVAELELLCSRCGRARTWVERYWEEMLYSRLGLAV